MFQFDNERALSAGTSQYIEESGVYKGTIKSVEIVDSTTAGSNSQSAVFSFETDNGQIASYCRLTIKKKDGSYSFGYDIFCALMGILHIKQALPVQRDGKVFVDVVCNRKIAFGLQKEFYEKNDGSIGYKFNVLNFYHYDTLRTYSELTHNSEAVVSKRPIVDKPLPTKRGGQSYGNGQSSTQQMDDVFGPVKPVDTSDVYASDGLPW